MSRKEYVTDMTDTNKQTLMRAFNSHFADFIDDVLSVFPDNTELQSAKTSFGAARAANPSLVVRAWHKCVFLPHEEAIVAGDISFFVDPARSPNLSGFQNPDAVSKIVDRFRGPVSQMSEESRSNVMAYIQVLSQVAAAYAAI
jgi:hypothetical protein